MTTTERIIKLLDQRTATRDKDPKAYEEASRQLQELRKREPTAWSVAMRWIAGPAVLLFALLTGSGCATISPVTTPNGTVQPMAGVRFDWSGGGLTITPYVRPNAFGLTATVGQAAPAEAVPGGARSLGGPVAVPPWRGCPPPRR